MNYAVDREAMVQTALFGYSRVACSPINLVWFYTDEYCYTYDLERAKQLMAESTAPDGFSASLMVTAGDTVANQLAVMLKDMLAQINVVAARRATASASCMRGSLLKLRRPGRFCASQNIPTRWDC